VAYGIVIEGARNVRDIREQAGYFNDFEIYSLVILVFRNQLKLILSKKRYALFLIILSLSSFFYLARTNFIQFIILVLALKGFFILNKRALKVIFTIITFSIIAYTSIYYYNPMRNGKGVDEFLYKIKIAPTEAFSTKINRENWKQFNDNYRSYENIRTVQQLSHNNSLFFGEGIGSQVDLKQKTYLGDMELRFISFLHNGYMTILLKTGFIGLLIYLSSILFFFKRNLSRNNELKNVNYFFIGTGIFLIFSNWVFMGIYNLEDTKSLFIGFMFAYKNDLQIRFNNSKV
jgi:O-antigen ligase